MHPSCERERERERERGHIASKKCKLARVGMVHTMFWWKQMKMLL